MKIHSKSTSRCILRHLWFFRSSGFMQLKLRITAPAQQISAARITVTPFFRQSVCNIGGNIVFGDGHATWFKYNYVCALINGKLADPGQPDILWAANGQRIP